MMEVGFTTEEMRCDIQVLERALSKAKEAQELLDKHIIFKK